MPRAHAMIRAYALMLRRSAPPVRAPAAVGLVACAAWAVLPPVARAQVADTAGASAPAAHGPGTPVLGELEMLGHSTVHVLASPVRWSAAEWLALPVAAGALGVMTLADGEVRDLMRRNRGGLDGVVLQVERLGTIENLWILAGFYAAGTVLGDERARATAVEGVVSSLIAAGLITPTLQLITGRKRPRTASDVYAWEPFSRNISFPSGHTTQAFAVASVIAMEYDAWWVDAASYGLAAAVAACRMYEDAHHLTDVAAAALIGVVVGRAVVRFGRRHRGELALAPGHGPGGPGLVARLRF